jgi:hypothetical protein
MLAGLLLAGAALGVAFEPDGTRLASPTAEPVGDLFVERAVFCPPALERSSATARVAVATPAGRALPLGFESGSATADLPRRRVLVRPVPAGAAVDVVGRGGMVAGSAVASPSDPRGGEGGTPCAAAASSDWYFGSGSSDAGSDER